MTVTAATRFFRSCFLFLLASACCVCLAQAQVTNTNSLSVTSEKVADASAVGAQESLRSYLQIQEQLHNTQLSIEKIRQEAETASLNSSNALQDRLGQMERKMDQTFDAQRMEEMKGNERSNRTVLIASAVFGVVGFIVLLMAAVLQWAAVNRLTAAASSLSAGQNAENDRLLSRPETEATMVITEVIGRLEERVNQIEALAKSPQLLSNGNGHAHANGNDGETKSLVMQSSDEESEKDVPLDKTAAINMLIGKCQSLLKLDKPEAALKCLDEVLTLDPSHADALVKKGATLERLQRFDEAIKYYDRAIAQDNSLTMAYLYKGGVFNRMERYREALECYELALKTRQKGQAANVIID